MFYSVGRAPPLHILLDRLGLQIFRFKLPSGSVFQRQILFHRAFSVLSNKKEKKLSPCRPLDYSDVWSRINADYSGRRERGWTPPSLWPMWSLGFIAWFSGRKVLYYNRAFRQAFANQGYGRLSSKKRIYTRCGELWCSYTSGTTPQAHAQKLLRQVRSYPRPTVLY